MKYETETHYRSSIYLTDQSVPVWCTESVTGTKEDERHYWKMSSASLTVPQVLYRVSTAVAVSRLFQTCHRVPVVLHCTGRISPDSQRYLFLFIKKKKFKLKLRLCLQKNVPYVSSHI